MATVDPHPFRNNARFYAPPQVMRLLCNIAHAEKLALIVDVDALERSTFARVERIMLMALDALSYVNVQIVLVSRNERAALLLRGVPKSWWVHRGSSLTELRQRIPSIRFIAITDDPGLLETLDDDDRAIGLGLSPEAARTNVLASGDVSVRAAL